MPGKVRGQPAKKEHRLRYRPRVVRKIVLRYREAPDEPITPPLPGDSMPLEVPPLAPMLFIRKTAFERCGMTRAAFDERLNLTGDEFRMEGDLIAIGPLPGESMLTDLIDEMESAGLTYFDDFFELSGNWPDWLRLYVMSTGESAAGGFRA